jgi:hypothetical protein
MEKLDHQEFLAYLFLYGASADLVIQKTEIDLILERVGKERYEKALELFEGKSDYERLQFILSHKAEHFPTEEEKEKVLGQLKEIFYADKDFSVMEQNIFRILQKIL